MDKASNVLLSIVVITYNHEKYVREALESILMQKVSFSYEIVIGDDCSIDNTSSILVEYKNKFPELINLILRDENIGATKNTYDLFLRCKGKYITILEGDDYWIDPYKLQKQVDFLENNRDYIGVSHVIEMRDNQGVLIGRHPSSPKIVGKEIRIDHFLQGIYFSATATVFRNIFANHQTHYDVFHTAHRLVGDYTLCMLLLDGGRVMVLDEPMAVYRVRSTSDESNYNSIRDTYMKIADHIQVINANREHFKDKYSFTDEYVRKVCSMLAYCIRNGGFRQCISIYKCIPGEERVRIPFRLPVILIKMIYGKIRARLTRGIHNGKE